LEQVILDKAALASLCKLRGYLSSHRDRLSYCLGGKILLNKLVFRS
jgi:hypothetical protein